MEVEALELELRMKYTYLPTYLGSRGRYLAYLLVLYYSSGIDMLRIILYTR